MLFGKRGFLHKPNSSLWNPLPPSPSPSPSSSPSTPSPLSPPIFTSSSSSTPSLSSYPSSPRSPIRYYNIHPPPKPPLVWTWQCHLCNRNWPVGTTQRCLYCGHRMCLPEQEQNRNRSSRKRKIICDSHSRQQPLLLSSLLSANSSDGIRLPMASRNSSEPVRQRYKQRLRCHYRKSRARQEKKKKKFHCKSEFDYAGWENRNKWRRDVKELNELKNKGMLEELTDEEEESDSEDTDSTLDEDEGRKREMFKLLPGTGPLRKSKTGGFA
ncbi:hypothetical protein TSTA_092960 [Talaromyces stipitatus ATCC 10500]|uniref:Uncharacterized protein n=1 Tax=Talaromyces stipitatus (strain ATCC 10500 / CBS 375.48 / QM 6759 / NRRL 1006) TaxID=441959 RepID=B8M374_TALSN|nr:uncharacterized protein TSTA_092960 [Talaromyces stipitatus ATCC 10500]EED22050.1 hypothetical protein TSTA_092960 [Talaromyces stipitatus ATCC 10500]